MNIETVERKNRPIPFWSWNEKLNTDETARQVRLMGKAGIGGFFMHARGGLQTPYMGEEWHDNIRSASGKIRSKPRWILCSPRRFTKRSAWWSSAFQIGDRSYGNTEERAG